MAWLWICLWLLPAAIVLLGALVALRGLRRPEPAAPEDAPRRREPAP